MKLNAIILGAAVAMTACHRTDSADTQGPMAVAVDTVVTDSVTLFKQYPGQLLADDLAKVVGRVNGLLLASHFTGGDHVNKGQILFSIDPTTYKIAVDEAEASLQEAISANEYAEQHYEAVARAFELNAVSRMELAQALSNRDQSRASVQNARAQLAQARETLGYCTVAAPLSGRISLSNYSPGAFIAGGTSPVALATIYADDVIKAKFSIEDASFLRMFANENNRHLIDYDHIPVAFTDSLPHIYTARLTNIDPNVDSSTGTISLLAHIKNPYGELRDGMYVSISLPYKVEPKAMVIRDASISTDQLGKFVYTVNDSNRVVYTPIKTGDLVHDTLRVVQSGLKPGQRYVSKAMLKVRDGMEIKPISTSK